MLGGSPAPEKTTGRHKSALKSETRKKWLIASLNQALAKLASRVNRTQLVLRLELARGAGSLEGLAFAELASSARSKLSPELATRRIEQSWSCRHADQRQDLGDRASRRAEVTLHGEPN